MKREKVLFLYGKIKYKDKAKIYCTLHKCYLSKQQLFAKKFKCEKCKYKKEVNEWDNT